MSYIVMRRTGEIGVRLALGAEPGSVARMIVRQGSIVALAGITVGLAAAFAGGRLIESLLYGISPRDPGVFAGMTTVLLSVALLACWLPGRRAAPQPARRGPSAVAQGIEQGYRLSMFKG